MRVGILGSGEVGKALARGFLEEGHDVLLSSRSASNPDLAVWQRAVAAKAAQVGSFEEAALFGDVLVLATLGVATPEVIHLAGPGNFRGKVVMDATNPLDFSHGFPPAILGGPGSSGGEIHQKLLPDAHVVKVFNSIGHALMYKPRFPGGVPDMFICGNHAPSKEIVQDICRAFGWNTVDVGGISASHYLEALCAVWILAAAQANNWQQAFKMLRC